MSAKARPPPRLKRDKIAKKYFFSLKTNLSQFFLNNFFYRIFFILYLWNFFHAFMIYTNELIIWRSVLESEKEVIHLKLHILANLYQSAKRRINASILQNVELLRNEI